MKRMRWVTLVSLVTTGCGIGEITVGGPKHGVADTQVVGSPDAGIIVNTTTFPIGRLTRMGNGLYRSINQYDALGRTTAVQHVMENVSYVYETTFGYANRAPMPPELGNVVATMTFPDGETVAYGYDVAGGQFSINATPAGATVSSTPNIVTKIFRNERDQTTEVDYGNGAAQFHCYNDGKTCGGVPQPNTDLRLSQISTTLNGTVQQYTYQFDLNGNVTSVVDGYSPGYATATYCYDSLDRLVSGGPNCVCGQSCLWNFGYDNFGNLTSKNGVAQTYVSGTHQLSCVGASCPTSGTTQTYDANGNTISRSDGLAIAWNSENMPTFVSGGAATTTTEKYFLGEALWKKVQGGVVTYFLPSMRVEDGLARKYFGSFAERSTDGTLKFYQSDHLGSATLVTGANGNVIRRASYQPFGEDRAVPIALFSPATGLRHEFNFKEQEQDGTGFYDYGARLYNPATGRWLSADSVVADGLNRYAYTRNNPLRYVDPTGHADEEQSTKGTKSAHAPASKGPNEGPRENVEQAKKMGEGIAKTAHGARWVLDESGIHHIGHALKNVGDVTETGVNVLSGVGIALDVHTALKAKPGSRERRNASASALRDMADLTTGLELAGSELAAPVALAVNRAGVAATILFCSDCTVELPPEARAEMKLEQTIKNNVDKQINESQPHHHEQGLLLPGASDDRWIGDNTGITVTSSPWGASGNRSSSSPSTAERARAIHVTGPGPGQ
jgi:RHS repeat-associated protein